MKRYKVTIKRRVDVTIVHEGDAETEIEAVDRAHVQARQQILARPDNIRMTYVPGSPGGHTVAEV